MRTSITLCVALVIMCGCFDSPSTPSATPNATPRIVDGSLALGATGTISRASYFTFRYDFRRCIFPLCGGFFLSSVNSEETRCSDGTVRSECYVAEIDGSALGLSASAFAALVLSDPGSAILQGSLRPKHFSGFGNLGALTLSGAWKELDSAPASTTVYRVWDGVSNCGGNCPALWAQVLNYDQRRSISELDLTTSGAEPPDIANAEAALADGFLLVTATSEEGSGGTVLRALQIYLPAIP